tara:strand:+ start:634 stop:1575 length:942 start_codon:yes stop_codon:yes gene_type:complete
MNKAKLPIFSIIGPTSIGKTQLAFDIEKKYPVEIISVDSAMIYRGMNIGTDKPNAETLSKIKHHLVNIRNPDEYYSVGDFYKDAHILIKNLHKKEKIPLFVGGTLMYFNQLYSGLNTLPKRCIETRNFIDFLAKKYSWGSLHECLKIIDSECIKKISENDHQRIQRNLEIYILTGKLPSSFFSEREDLAKKFNLITIKLFSENRNDLQNRIEQRTKEMFKNKLVDEVLYLKEKYSLSLKSQSMKAIGYNQAMRYLDGELSYSEAIIKTIFATRQLGKRQITWLKKFNDAIEVNIKDKLPNSFFSKIEKSLQFL